MRFALLFMFALNAHAVEFPPVVVATEVANSFRLAVAATPTATSTATATATATVSGPILVQQKTGTFTGGALTVTFNTPLTAGSYVVALISLLGASDISDSSCSISTLQLDASATIAGTGLSSQIRISNGIVDGGETAVVFTLGHGGTGVLVMNVQEWSGFASAAANSNTNSDALSSTVTTNDVTPTFDSNVMFAVGAWTANSYSTGPTNGFTRLTPINGAGIYQEGAYLIQSSATNQSTGWTLTGGVSWTAAIIGVDQGP